MAQYRKKPVEIEVKPDGTNNFEMN